MQIMEKLYEGDYKRYLLIPAVLFVLFLGAIFIFPSLQLGIDFTGGTLITALADEPLDGQHLEQVLNEKYELTELQILTTSNPLGYKVSVQFSQNPALAEAESLLMQAKEQLQNNPENAKQLAIESASFSTQFTEPKDISSLTPQRAVSQSEELLIKAEAAFKRDLQNTIINAFPNKNVEIGEFGVVGPSIGSNFFESGIIVSLIAFALVTLVVFLFFREVVPSAAVIAAIIFDIFGALALMAIFSIPLSLFTIPALLMLIGYSVDTDLMLTARLLKRKEEDAKTRAAESMVTGLTMTITTLAALLSMLILSYLGQIRVVFEISAVLLFGLLADILSTWLMNAPVLLWYAEKKEGSK